MHFRFKSIFVLVSLLLTLNISVAQINTLGTPLIRNYSRMDYNAGLQNWMIDIGKDGRIYFANNEGLLVYNGTNWKLFELPGQTIVRSLLIADDGKIYIGGYNEFGYFIPDAKGGLEYHSLIHLLKPQDRNFDEIWRIHKTSFGLVFQSFSNLIIIQGNSATLVDAPGVFHFSYYIHGKLLAIDLEKGILEYYNGSFFPLPGTQVLKGHEIVSILPVETSMLIITADKGAYLYNGNELQAWSTPASDFITENQAFTAIHLDKHLAFGTVQNGLLICNKDGQLIQHINRNTGLQNNTILSLFLDDSKNLWLGTDNGIDYVEVNSPLSAISYAQGVSAGYTAILHEGILYLGTNQGVFYQDYETINAMGSNIDFKLLNGVRGQIWNLQLVDGELFCGGHNGTFLIKGRRARQISDIPGGWVYVQLPAYPNHILGGTYSGLILFERKNGSYEFVRRIKGFRESSRLMETDEDGSIWMSHGFKGVFHLYLNRSLDSLASISFYNAQSGFPESYGINVFRINDEVRFATSEGIYEFSPAGDEFIKSEPIHEALSGVNLSKVIQDARGNIWYFSPGELGLLKLEEDGSYENITLPFKQLSESFIGGFEFVYSLNERYVLIGSSDGFTLYKHDIIKDYEQEFNTYISEVRQLNPNSLLFQGFRAEHNIWVPDIRFRNNGLLFSFSSNDFENPNRTTYSTFLEGYDENWTDWDHRNFKEYTNLFEGVYTLRVKAKNIYGVEAEEASFSFSVHPPWERSTLAYIVYALMLVILIFLFVLHVRRRVYRSRKEEENIQKQRFRKREDELQREALEAEKEIIRLRNEKLKEEMVQKDKELANSTLATIQKNKLLKKIENELDKLKKATREDELKFLINNLNRRIQKERDSDRQWEIFETHFESVHEAFLKRIKEKYPELSPRELKLCAYLRLNISSKEIASLMNISTRGVEISRYRLRKKLDLERNENLTEFILSF